MLYYLAAMNAICIQTNPVMCIHVYAIHGCYVFKCIQSCVFMYMRYMDVMFFKQTLLTDRLTDRKRKGGMDGSVVV